MRRVIFLLVVSLLSALPGMLGAESRIALLIANGAYHNLPPLSGPVMEERQLAVVLSALGFDVEVVENGSREQMLDSLDRLKTRIKGTAGTVFFHYGGHGIQVNGKNYLIPADAEIPDERKVETRAVELDEVMSSLEISGAATCIIVLDACRNNPLSSAARSAVRGLTPVSRKPRNSVVVYSAEAGTVAQDGLFTPSLTAHLGEKNRSFADILLEVRNDVAARSGGNQIPGEYNQLFNNIYLNGVGQSITINAAADRVPVPAVDGQARYDFLDRANSLVAAGKNQELVNIIPSSAWAEDPDLLRILGDAYRNLRRFQNAVEVYTRLLAKDPQDAQVWAIRGKVQADMGFQLNHNKKYFRLAVEDYTKSLAIDDHDVSPWLDRAQSLIELNRLDEALADCQHVLGVQPDNEYLYVNLVIIYTNSNRKEDAKAAIARWMIISPYSEADTYCFAGDWYSRIDRSVSRDLLSKAVALGSSRARELLDRLR